MGHGGGRDDVAGGSWVRLGGLLLATIALVVGVWALALPRSFYALLAVAVIVLERRLVQAALAAWLVYAVPHFVFHATELDALPFLDNAANVITLGLAVLLPLVLLVATGRRRAESGGRR